MNTIKVHGALLCITENTLIVIIILKTLYLGFCLFVPCFFSTPMSLGMHEAKLKCSY